MYTTIDYGSSNASRTHAHIAAAYLTGEVERIVPHDMPDVLMEGARLIGQCADLLLAAEGPNGIQTLVDRLGIIGCCGIAKEDYRPVTLACVEQLSRLSFNLLQVRSGEIRFVAEAIRKRMTSLGKLFLAVPDTPLARTHTTFLGPYHLNLSMRLTALVNALVDAKADDENARRFITNFREWADGLHRTEKEFLLEAIRRRSQFAFDMMRWISQMTMILLAASTAPACDRHNQQQLRRHAVGLISVLSFVPGDIDSVEFVETFGMTETLFEAALEGHRRQCADVARDIASLLVSWMFKGGQYQSGWAILERSIYGSAVLALLDPNTAIAKLKAEMSKRLAAGGLPDQEVKDHAALAIRGQALALRRQGGWVSSIERGMARADHATLEPLLNELADLISPQTAGQSTEQHFF